MVHLGSLLFLCLYVVSSMASSLSSQQQDVPCHTIGNNAFNVTFTKTISSQPECGGSLVTDYVIPSSTAPTTNLTVNYCYTIANIGWNTFLCGSTCIDDFVRLYNIVDDNGTPTDLSDDIKLSDMHLVSVLVNPNNISYGQTLNFSKTVTLDVCTYCDDVITFGAKATVVDITAYSSFLSVTKIVSAPNSKITLPHTWFDLPTNYSIPDLTVNCSSSYNSTLPDETTHPVSKIEPLCEVNFSYRDNVQPFTGCLTNDLSITRSWTISGCAGASSSVNQLVTILSKPLSFAILPSYTTECFADCVDSSSPANTKFIRYLNPSSLSPLTTSPVRVSSSCGATSQIYVDGSVDVGLCGITFNRTWTVNDSCTSQNKRQAIIAIDTEAPTFDKIPPPTVVACRHELRTLPQLSWTASDGCYGACAQFDPANYRPDMCTINITADTYVQCAKTRNIYATVVDPCGHTTNASTYITTTDTGPSFTPRPAPTILCSNYEDDITNIPANHPRIEDNCSSTGIPKPFFGQLGNWTCYNQQPVAPLIVKWTLTTIDECYTLTANQPYIINDNVVMDIAPINPVTYDTCVAGSNHISSLAPPAVTRSCSPYTLEVTDAPEQVSGIGAPNATIQEVCGMKIVRNYTLKNVCATQVTSRLNVYFKDSEAPVIQLNKESFITLACGEAPPNAEATDVSVMDRCFSSCVFNGLCGSGSSGVSSNCQFCVKDSEVIPECCSESRVVVRTWRAEDVCGNVAIVTQTFVPTGSGNCTDIVPCSTNPTPVTTPTPLNVPAPSATGMIGCSVQIRTDPNIVTIPGSTKIFAGFAISKIPKGASVTVLSGSITVNGKCLCSSYTPGCVIGFKNFNCSLPSTPITYTSTNLTTWYPTGDPSSTLSHQFVCDVPSTICVGSFQISSATVGYKPVVFSTKLSTSVSGFYPTIKFHASVAYGAKWTDEVRVECA